MSDTGVAMAMRTASLLLLVLMASERVHAQDNCSYQDVLDYLNLKKTNERFSLTRPVKNHTRPTRVHLEVLLYAILDVVEKEQKFIPYLWTTIRWQNEYISWDPNKFCGIRNVSLPTELLWKPDLLIEEMTEKDKAPPSPYLTINNEGGVEAHYHQVLVSTCRMRIYNFPFDMQSCNLSFKSVIHSAKDLQLRATDNSSEATEYTLEVMRTQYEWLFINMTVTNKIANDTSRQDVIVYTINMRRRSTLYIVNFIVPILFFLFLDFASFLISDNSGEKLSFQVTVLLAVTVLQLILNEILPSSSNWIPLIAVYCIGIFALMMLSLLETIVLMYLVEKDSAPRDCGTDTDRRLSGNLNKQEKDDYPNYDTELHNWTEYMYENTAETPSEQMSMAKEHVSSSNLVEENHVLEKVSEDLREMEKTLTQLLRSKTQDHEPGYWTRVARTVNRIFFIFYVTMVTVFLIVLFSLWTSAG